MEDFRASYCQQFKLNYQPKFILSLDELINVSKVVESELVQEEPTLMQSRQKLAQEILKFKPEEQYLVDRKQVLMVDGPQIQREKFAPTE